MELDITRFFNEACPRDYSASAAELGQDAGRITWAAACDDAPDYNILDTDEKREAFRAYVKDFGAWDDEEIAAWTDVELNALLLQFISGDMREGGLDGREGAWSDYYRGAEAGRVAGRLCEGTDGRVYYNIGS